MHSIDREQPEDTHEDLSGEAAIKLIRELVEQAQTGFFCTTSASTDAQTARPMSVREIDEEGKLWFLSPTDSHTNQDLARDPSVTLYFQHSARSGFLQLQGRANVSQDRARIRALWTPLLRTWFTGGVEDPRISVICVTPTEGYYWDNKHGETVAGVKMLIGAALRKTLDDSVQGRLHP